MKIAGVLVVVMAVVMVEDTQGGSNTSFGSLVLEVPGVIYENEMIIFNCSDPNGGGVVNFTWTRDGNPIEGGFEGRLEVVVPLSWAGSCLTCHVMDANISQILNVLSAFPSITLHPSNQTIDEGEPLSLECGAIGLPPPVVVLKKDGVTLYPPTTMFSTDNATPDDAGVYVCMAMNEVGLVTSDEAVIRVRSTPLIQTSPEDLDALSNSVVTLNCSARGYPIPTITWFHNDEVVNDTGGRVLIHSNGSLIIISLVLTDSGCYYCRASNVLGSVDSDTAMLMVDLFPMFLETPTNTRARFHDRVQLNCSASGIPDVTYIWIRCVGDSEAPVILNDRVTEVNGVLTFDPTDRSDAGMYKCIAGNEHGNVTSSCITLEIIALPLPPEDLVLVASDSSWFKITWAVSSSLPPINHYRISYKLTFEPVWTEINSTNTMMNITDLYPNAMYEVRVRGVSDLGDGNSTIPLLVVTTEGVPTNGLLDGAVNVSVQSNHSNTLILTWDIPQVLQMTSYLSTILAVYNDGDMHSQQIMAVSPYVLSGLLSDTSYLIVLTFIFVGGDEGPPFMVNGTTMEGVPGDAPTNVMVSLTDFTLQVTWDPPSQPNGDIILYTLYYSPPPMSSVAVETRSHVLHMLRPYTNYSIAVSANTLVGEGPRGPEGGVFVLTDQDVPPAPLGLSVKPLSSTTILVSWRAFNEEDVPGIIVDFTIVYNQLYQVAGHNQTSIIVEDLTSYTEYNISIAASTVAGLGNFTPIITTQTFGDVPGASVDIISVMVVCPSHLMVEWTLPNLIQLSGPEDDTQYILTYEADEGVANNVTFPYMSSLSSHVISVPRPFTNYKLQLALFNQNGTGNYSNSVSILSCDGAANPPVNITVTTLNSTAVGTTWMAPPTIPGTLVGYVLKYGTRDGSSMEVNTSRTEYVIENLEPFVEYGISLATRTHGPQGNFSLQEYVMTIGDVPIVEVSNVVISISDGMCLPFIITWDYLDPQDVRGSIDSASYIVVYNSSTTPERSVVVPYSQGPMANLINLMVNTEYDVRVKIENGFGCGPFSSVVTMTTPMEGVPSPPRNVSVMFLNATSLMVKWVVPTTPNGLLSYYVHYNVTSMDDGDDDVIWPVANTHQHSVVLNGLHSFTNYTIIVFANTSCGDTSAPSLLVQTLESPPTPPLNVSIVAILPTRIKVQWKTPTNPNGIITHYNVSCSSDRAPMTVFSPLLNYECDGLTSETSYTISVSAVNGAGEGVPNTIPVTTSCSPSSSVTPQVEKGVITITLDRSCSIRTTYLLVVVQELVSYYDRKYDRPTKTLDNYVLEELLALTEDFKNRISGRGRRRGRRQAINEEGGVYIAANLTEEGLIGSGFTLGDNLGYGVYTNYFLNPQIFYNVALWGRVIGTDTPLITLLSSQDPIIVSDPVILQPSFPLIPVLAATGAAGIVILAICMAAFISCVCCCCSRSLDKTGGTSDFGVGGRTDRSNSFRLSTKKKYADPVEDFRANNRTEALEDHPQVPVMGFVNKLMVMRTNDNQLFLEEFGSIAMTTGLSTDVANLSVNRSRNRYNNILPYDANRVKVKGHGMDYINANYCSGYRRSKAYIATQGPLPDTIGDFWKIVWEENIQTLVMLTNTQEKGKIKCEVYWPREVGRSTVHSYLDVTLSSLTTLADYTIRKFILQKAGSTKEPREVVQFHFTSWPDHGVPQYATAMLAMIRKIRSRYSFEEGPMLVHCSAGVGRTGTFIVIDSMLQRLVNEEDMIDIYGHVSLLRTQRNYMVQTEDQYFFIHEAIAEALLCGNTEVPLDHLPGYVADLCSVIPEDESDTTNLELQFKRLALERNDPYRWMTASKDANKTKNRFINVLPYDSSRVCLEYSPGVDGSDYINASHVDSYRSRRAFIATQGPLVNTVEDFWRMLWQYSVPVVVMLTKQIERGHECSARYWPVNNDQPINFGKLKVNLNVERKSSTYSYRDFCITNTTNQEKRWIQHFQFHGWPEVGVPSPVTLLDFLREVQNLCQSLHIEGPIVVHCSNGVGRTGVFLALHMILERVLAEGLIDVFQTVKNLRIQRPAMVQTLEQYHFCYDSTVTYLKSSEHLFPSPLHVTASQGHKRGSSQRNSSHGSRHGSRASLDSGRKKSKTASPARSPTRTGSLRNTPIHSDSKKDSPKNTMNLQNNGSTPQFYGGSDTTTTFGSYISPNFTHQPGSEQVASPLISHAQTGVTIAAPSPLISHGVTTTIAAPSPLISHAQTGVTIAAPSPLISHGTQPSQVNGQLMKDSEESTRL